MSPLAVALCALFGPQAAARCSGGPALTPVLAPGYCAEMGYRL
ncbi:hypothetical protein PSNTI_06420 [Stutzerimonas stutzeri]|nr:hypothetical protein PSNTI_06420 [Stutzerimonas stutzeri]